MELSQSQLSRRARVRLGEVLAAFETNRKFSVGAVITHHSRRMGTVESLSEAAARIVGRNFGWELRVNHYDLKGSCLTASVEHLLHLIMGSCAHLQELEGIGGAALGASHHFAEEIEELVQADRFPFMFDEEKCGWTPRVSSDAEALRRALLEDPSDAAGCAQGDPQTEMVISTVQTALGRPDAVFVDYGAGLGRVLVGLGSADLFRKATYIAVDEPISTAVKALAKTVGAKFVATPRERFLSNPSKADAVILVNTLHHIPFDDVPRQINALLTALKAGGVLVVQEIGELREPEQLNVPWRTEDIIELFSLPGCTRNPRGTVTRSKKVPLTHMLVHLDGPVPSQEVIAAKCREIWQRMKAHTLDEIRALYASSDPNDHLALQHAFITNANLDLNKPR